MVRSRVYGIYVNQYLGPKIHKLYTEWGNAMRLVFDTVRWALFHLLGKQEPLSKYVVSRSPGSGSPS
jgi:hypothetical protein